MLVLSGEAGMGTRASGRPGWQRPRSGSTDPECRGVEAEASLSFAGLSERFPRGCSRRSGESLLLRAGGRSRSRSCSSSQASRPPIRTRSGSPCWTVRAHRAGPSRRARQRSVARSGVGGRAPDRVPAPSRRAARAARDLRLARTRREPDRARAFVPGRAARAVLAWPVEPRRSTACSKSGSAWS